MHDRKADRTPATNVMVAQLVEMKQELFTKTKFLYECLQRFIETTAAANRRTEETEEHFGLILPTG
jgi:hypothetical protein